MSNIGNISRRNFFKLALGGAVVAATVSPAVAAVLKQTYADKIKHVIRLHSELVAGYEGSQTSFEELLSYLLENFTCPKKGEAEYEVARNAVSEIFNNKELKADWRDVPPTLPEAGVVVSVIRDLLSKRRIKIDVAATPSFERFANEYQDLILNS
ncbi:hypothetical protein D3C87_768530 [compost metagenome]